VGFKVSKGLEHQKDDEQWCLRSGNQGGEEPCCDNHEVHREDPLVRLEKDLVGGHEDGLTLPDVVLDEGIQMAEEKQGADECDASVIWWGERHGDASVRGEEVQEDEIEDVEAAVMAGEGKGVLE